MSIADLKMLVTICLISSTTAVLGGGTLRGAVQCQLGGGMENVTVFLEDENGFRYATLTQADGSYQFSNLSGGWYDQYLGYPESEWVVSPVGGLHSVNLKENGLLELTTIIAGEGVAVSYGKPKRPPQLSTLAASPSLANEVIATEQGGGYQFALAFMGHRLEDYATLGGDVWELTGSWSSNVDPLPNVVLVSFQEGDSYTGENMTLAQASTAGFSLQLPSSSFSVSGDIAILTFQLSETELGIIQANGGDICFSGHAELLGGNSPVRSQEITWQGTLALGFDYVAQQ